MAHPTHRFRSDDAFAAALRPTRVAAGVTLAQLAQRLGLPTSSIARIEQGTRRASVGEALVIAWLLGTTVDALAGSWERPLMKAPPGRPRRST